MNGTFLPSVMGSHHACDCIGGTVKWLVTIASLQQPLNNQILTADKMFEFGVEEIKRIVFCILKKSRNW